MSVCAVVWCDRTSVVRGLCKRCYARYKRGLGPNQTRQYTTRETRERVRYEVAERRIAGESIADIAASVGINESTLGKWFREWDVRPAAGKFGRSLAPNQWRPWTRDDAVVAYTRTDLSIAERAELLGRSYTAVAGFVRDYRQRSGDPYGIK
ncbi:helix-turn-helix domain-containing protein [Brevibacterium sp. UCMA 11754]|uniref:helix-turn-helix domain-containing protein n=1 Tax=Brevibacterium sp. UCMA 11754 TaxID=2749198 RepID=UPI001F182DF2|nr:helix-turn-helix domain-containing protein [Brevibacterium sp. UCMA 11754]MCF2572859.1 helix-turn-helix domain-containing protein [Brevibacterium sp. UCMA 11754]